MAQLRGALKFTTEHTEDHVAAQPQPNCFARRFLGVLRDLAVKLCVSIHRQDAKNAKKSAKRKFFPGEQGFSAGGPTAFTGDYDLARAMSYSARMYPML